MKATVPISVILGSALVSHEIRIRTLEEHRFTRADAKDLQSGIQEWVATSQPPEWLKENIREIKDSMKEIASRLRALEQRGK